MNPAHAADGIVFKAFATRQRLPDRPAIVLLALLALATTLPAAAAPATNSLSAAEAAAGWRLLWDGQTSQGWQTIEEGTFPSNRWVIQNGEIRVRPAPNEDFGNCRDLVTREKFSSFELVVDFKLTQGANSGVKYFVRSNLDPATGKMIRPELTPAIGCEYQILDDERHPDAKLGRDGNRKLGSLYDLIPAPPSKPLNPMGAWNTARIVVEGNHVEHWLNGVKLLAYDRNTPVFDDLVGRSKFKRVAGFGDWVDGHILLQDHGGEVSFRNIKLRKLPAP